MKRARLVGTAAAIGAGLASAWVGLTRADRRALARDPKRALLDAELAGRRFELSAGDGTRLHGQQFGPADAPAVVLAHGWTCSHRFWAAQIEELVADHRLIAYDLRGHGQSGRSPHGDYTIDAHAADLAVVLRQLLGGGERAVVAGHSMGAMGLVAMAGNDPRTVGEKVAAAALINTGMGDLLASSEVLRIARAGGDRVARLVHRAFSSAAPLPRRPTPLSRRLVRHIALDRGASPAEVAFCERLILACPGEVRGPCGRNFSELDLYRSLARLEVPTAVIAGTNDRLTPLSHARRIVEELPRLDGALVTREAGHMMPVTHPGVISARLRALAADHLAAAPASLAG